HPPDERLPAKTASPRGRLSARRRLSGGRWLCVSVGLSDCLYLGVADEVLAGCADLVEGGLLHGYAEGVLVVDADGDGFLGVGVGDLDQGSDGEDAGSGGQ